MIRKMASSQNLEDIVKSLKTVVENIQKAVERRPSHLPSLNPRLVAVSKTKPIKDIVTAYNQGQRHFGENYVTELEEKAMSPLILNECKDIRWHMIGHLQRNKTNKVTILPNLYMVETVDSAKLAQTLSNQWEKFQKPGKLCVMVQVNTSGESNKSGCNPEGILDLVTFIKEKCPHLTFSGLMTIGAFGHDPTTGPNEDFLRLVKFREDLCQELNLSLADVELSMGMSSDYEHAIELGSSNIRVGSTIFGARPSPKPTNNTNSPAGGSEKSETKTDSQSASTNDPSQANSQSNIQISNDSSQANSQSKGLDSNDPAEANSQPTNQSSSSPSQSLVNPITTLASENISKLNNGIEAVNIDDKV